MRSMNCDDMNDIMEYLGTKYCENFRMIINRSIIFALPRGKISG